MHVCWIEQETNMKCYKHIHQTPARLFLIWNIISLMIWDLTPVFVALCVWCVSETSYYINQIVTSVWTFYSQWNLINNSYLFVKFNPPTKQRERLWVVGGKNNPLCTCTPCWWHNRRARWSTENVLFCGDNVGPQLWCCDGPWRSHLRCSATRSDRWNWR